MELLLIKDGNKQMKLHGDSSIIVHLANRSVGFAPVVLIGLLLTFAAGHQTVLVHHQTGLAAVAVTTLGYQISHLTAAKVAGPVSPHAD